MPLVPMNLIPIAIVTPDLPYESVLHCPSYLIVDNVAAAEKTDYDYDYDYDYD
jgi:hypothetical protein